MTDPLALKFDARQLLAYDSIKRLASELHRPASTLIALAPINDPFCITPNRRDGAQWFARLWKRLAVGSDVHLRRLHYAIISQAKPVKMSDGKPYENTQSCWQHLIRTSNDARYLDLVPAEDFVDRRNDDADLFVECMPRGITANDLRRLSSFRDGICPYAVTAITPLVASDNLAAISHRIVVRKNNGQ